MSVLSWNEFLEADEPEFDLVPVKGGTVRIGSITAEDWVSWTELRGAGPDGRRASGALLISRSLVDDAGNRIGNDGQALRVQKMNLRTSETLLKAIFKLNGISQEGDEKNV